MYYRKDVTSGYRVEISDGFQLKRVDESQAPGFLQLKDLEEAEQIVQELEAAEGIDAVAEIIFSHGLLLPQTPETVILDMSLLSETERIIQERNRISQRGEATKEVQKREQA